MRPTELVAHKKSTFRNKCELRVIRMLKNEIVVCCQQANNNIPINQFFGGTRLRPVKCCLKHQVFFWFSF